MDEKKCGERSMRWQKTAAFLLVIALLIPLLVTVAGPLLSGGYNLTPNNSESWSRVEFYEDNSLPVIGATFFDSIAVNWGSRIVIPNIEKLDDTEIEEIAVNWGSRTIVPLSITS
ncbi:MAG: hypothetical protein H6667_15880 [Ardenticatenaceae bacterium]|nr:hypothetical protein [Ardenticatenaceae bacterium]MCB9443701.1 hypothetical protein [Ardenticatenaceae bacterium]